MEYFKPPKILYIGREEIVQFLLDEGADLTFKKEGLYPIFPFDLAISPLVGSVYYGKKI